MYNSNFIQHLRLFLEASKLLLLLFVQGESQICIFGISDRTEDFPQWNTQNVS